MTIWIILLLVMIASYAVQSRLDKKFRAYSEVQNNAHMTGAQIAQKMLSDNGIHDVLVKATNGTLTDYYDPANKTVNLSEGVFESDSIAAAAVAAHECGHAVQHAKGYIPLKLRTVLVPAVNFANKAVQWVLLIGVVLIESFPIVLWIGIGLFALTTLFSIMTLPVEFNASRRALAWIENKKIANYETMPMAQKALKLAASTYLIAALGSLATLIYYITAGRRR